jgi:hypothetical protein
MSDTTAPEVQSAAMSVEEAARFWASGNQASGVKFANIGLLPGNVDAERS